MPSKFEFNKGKMVPYPSGAIVPDRDLGQRPALECIHLGIEFGGLKAVDDFSLTIGKTEIAGLIGPNGAGKTTVFNLLTKVYQPTHGTILLDGEDIYAQQLDNRGFIVMGNEGKGISPELTQRVNRRLLIPNFPPERPTADSLNVAIATAITCSEFRRQGRR